MGRYGVGALSRGEGGVKYSENSVVSTFQEEGAVVDVMEYSCSSSVGHQKKLLETSTWGSSVTVLDWEGPLKAKHRCLGRSSDLLSAGIQRWNPGACILSRLR